MCDTVDSCGYGGFCNTTIGICICKEGFTDVGHLQLIPGRNCNVPVKAREILALVSICVLTVLFLMRLIYLRLEIRKSIRTRYSSSSMYRIRLTIYGLFADLFAISGAATHYFFPEVLIGQDILATATVFMFDGIAWWVQVLLYTEFFARLCYRVMNSPQKEAELRPLMVKFSFVIAFGLLNFKVIPNFGLYMFGPEYSDLFAAWHCFGFVILMLASRRYVVVLLTALIDTTDDMLSIQNGEDVKVNKELMNKMKSMKENFVWFRKTIMRETLQNMLIFSCVGIFPLLRSYIPVSVASVKYVQ